MNTSSVSLLSFAASFVFLGIGSGLVLQSASIAGCIMVGFSIFFAINSIALAKFSK